MVTTKKKAIVNIKKINRKKKKIPLQKTNHKGRQQERKKGTREPQKKGGKSNYSANNYLFFGGVSFLGPHLWHMEVPIRGLV